MPCFLPAVKLGLIGPVPLSPSPSRLYVSTVRESHVLFGSIYIYIYSPCLNYKREEFFLTGE